MDKYYKWKVLLIVVIIAGSLWMAYPPAEKINLGLDLQGGIQMLLEVQLDKIPEEAREDATARVTEIIRNRIDEFGVKEPVITKQGKDQVVVQLPGVTDRDRAKEIVGKTAHLEFKLVSDDSELLAKAEAGTVPEGYEYKEIKEGNMGTSQILVEQEAELTGQHLTNAWVGFGQLGEPNVQLQFDKEGGKIFDKVTFQNVGKRLAIILDGKVHSAPVIRDRIPNGQAVISGNFTVQESSDLSLVLRAGALPAPVEIIEERTVGPTLGQDSVQKGLRAGLIGAILVFLFMPGYYLLAGFVADIGLILYSIIVIGGMAAFHSSWTLPGIAGFILSIGMAVDANVLIFERMREEIETGKMARGAVSAGFHKAFSAILDSNVTTLVTSLILFVFGTGPIKGFAVTLTIGIMASMFSAIFISRVILDYLVVRNPNMKFKMKKLFAATHIPFLKRRIFAYGFSTLTLLIGVSALFFRGHENYGVEFTGGTSIQIAFTGPVEIGDLRSSLEKSEFGSLVIQRYGSNDESQFLIKTSATDLKRLDEALKSVTAGGEYKILRVDSIGPTVSGDLRGKALKAVFWASLGILIYLGWRFEWKFALAAVIAIVHDSVFAFGMYALSGREINIPTIAAVLTIMGFSVNDTIVTFDRVRDNLKIMRKTKFEQIVDVSINQTLSRTILTSLTVLFATISLFLFGGAAINDFAFILLVGFSVGIYSTIFVATSLIVDWKAH